MLGTAIKLAGLGAVAIIHAIVVLLRTDKVGDRLGVLGCVWRSAIGADTVESKSFLPQQKVFVSGQSSKTWMGKIQSHRYWIMFIEIHHVSFGK